MSQSVLGKLKTHVAKGPPPHIRVSPESSLGHQDSRVSHSGVGAGQPANVI